MNPIAIENLRRHSLAQYNTKSYSQEHENVRFNIFYNKNTARKRQGKGFQFNSVL